MTTKPAKKQISICVMIGDVSYDFSAELMKGIFHTAEREGVQLMYMMGMPRHAEPVEPGSEQTTAYHHNIIYDYAYLFGADAYILSCGSLSGFESENAYKQFLQRFNDAPAVILQERIGPDQTNKISITVDNYNSFCQCIEHLILKHNCKTICFLAGIRNHPDNKERMRAYLDTMRRYGLAVTDSMIEYGDFSEFSDALVSRLLDNNPNVDAIAFCNDEMARGGYRVCSKRGIKVGKELAFTGFDNFSTSRTLMPPLTTVSQNIYHMGELAVLQAIELVNGKQASSMQLDTSFHIRRSCGCFPDTVRHLFQADGTATGYAPDRVFPNIAADLKTCYLESERRSSDEMIDTLISYMSTLDFDTDLIVDRYQLTDWLQAFTDRYTDSTFLLAMRLNDYMVQMPAECLCSPFIRRLYDLFSFIHGFLFSYQARMVEKSLDDFRAQSWFIPEFIRDLVDSDLEESAALLNVVKRLRGINLDSVYICLLPEAQPLHNADLQHMPNLLFLAAYGSGSVLKAYPRASMPVVDAQHSLRSLPNLDGNTHLMSFSIFSGNIQYGILLCEVDVSKGSLAHVIGLQLGILINFLDLKRKEKIIGGQLENIIERNQILNFLSEYDPLCNILNRRGFIEQAIHLNRENIGRPAICVFMDLDHLKQINDTFGHSAGDTALTGVCDILKKTVRRDDLIARIGGDEFVGMFINDNPEFDRLFRERLVLAFDEFNSTSTLPFYVEASMGIAHFVCEQSLEISRIVSQADRYLYEEKKKRRPSALK